MANLLVLEVIINNKNYHQIVINIFQKYANRNFEGKLL